MAGKDRFLIGIAAIVLIIAAFVLVVVLTGSDATSERQIPETGIPDYVLTGGDDTLYLFSGDNVTALASDGALKYRFTSPAGWDFCSRWHIESRSGDNVVNGGSTPIATENQGNLYVYLMPENACGTWTDGRSSSGYIDGILMAVGPDGKALWNVTMKSLAVTMYGWPLQDEYATFSDAFLRAQGGRVYLFHGYNETIIDLPAGCSKHWRTYPILLR